MITGRESVWNDYLLSQSQIEQLAVSPSKLDNAHTLKRALV